tara:strand:- start:13796 stop:14296 length:501 start_codon:yes stop_codon:yes gene_type:complete
MNYIYNNFNKPYFWAFLISTSALIFALYLEYIASLKPCHLCILQRYAYGITLILSLLAFIYKFKKIISFLICISMLVTLMIAFWHLGIEFQWWLPSSSCSNWDTNIGSLTEELNNNLLESRSSNCDILSPKFLGITLVQWSFIYIVATTFFITILTYKMLKKKNYG